MMRKYWLLFFLFVVGLSSAIAQDDPSSTGDPDEEKSPEEFVFRPTLGLGVGMLTYYGEISKGKATNNPIVNQIGYEMRVTQGLTDYLDLNFYMLLGKISANERSIDRNLNFESRITAGGMQVSYNFDHLLKPDRIIDPYISVGIESMEFLSKTDLIDEFGNTYNYWSDGTIRNLPEDDVNAENAIRIQRDYEYETDIRALNADGFGDYEERTWGIPVGAGVNMYLSRKFSFRIGTTLHYTLTDYLDGLTPESVGNRSGDDINDMILFSSFNINYNLGIHKKGPDDPDYPVEIDGDEDDDGVIDLADECPGTPAGATVDEKGCPLDTDDDGFPDPYDFEIASDTSFPVNDSGILMNEEQLERLYLVYTDTTGKYVVIEDTSYALTEGLAIKVPRGPRFRLIFGQYDGAVPEDVANALMSLPSVRIEEGPNGKTTIYLGDEKDLEGAIELKKMLEEMGISTGKIAKQVTPNTIVPLNTVVASEGFTEIDSDGNEREVPLPKGEAYRVQVGAFGKRPSNEVFEGLPELVRVKGADGLWRYYTGAFPSYGEAATAKVRIVNRGFTDAFVVPFKDGHKVSLREVGAQLAPGFDPNPQTPPGGGTTNPTPGSENVRYRVQLGAYEADLPTNDLEFFMTLGTVDNVVGPDGLTRYFVGDFGSYNEAKEFQQTLEGQNINSFVVGTKDGQIISAQEARQLKGQ